MTHETLHALIADSKGHLAGGVYRTYTPFTMPDGEQARLHRVAIDLEQQGKIKRVGGDQFHVCWKVNNEQQPATVASQEVHGGVSPAVPERLDEGRDSPVREAGNDVKADSAGT